MRKRLFLAGLMGLVMPLVAFADVAPLTPEGRIIMQKHEAFENHARRSFSDNGFIEKLRDWRRNWGFVIVGEQGARRAPRVLVKDEYGWFEMAPGQTRRLPANIGHELNRLLTSGAIWSEDAYKFSAACRDKPRLFIVAHAGHDQFGRLGCGSEGLAARAARVAETLRVPHGGPTGVLPAVERPPVPGVPIGQQRNNGDIFERLSEMTAAWERRTLAGFVDPYADDVVVERPEGIFKGRKAFVDWVKSEQNWLEPYPERPSRRVLHQMTMAAQPSNETLYTTHELRWEEEGQLKRQTFSTMWRNNKGLWQIAHERVSAVKPVTDGRPL